MENTKRPIGIMTDSHSGITREEAEKLGIRVLPMPFYIGDTCYYEDVSITREAFYEKLRAGVDVSTSQPSPEAVMKMWDELLCEYEEIIYVPISSGLSGSCYNAMAMAQDEAYAGKVYVVDNGRVATPLHRSLLDAVELIDEGYSAAEVKRLLEAAKEDMTIYIGVATLEYLKKGGRIKPGVAAIGTMLNIKPVLKFDIGTLDTYRKCRGIAAMKKEMIKAMREDLDTKFKKWRDKGEVYLLAASSSASEETAKWVQEIKEAFPDMEVMCDQLSLGVSCHIGPDGLGIGCSCRPAREGS